MSKHNDLNCEPAIPTRCAGHNCGTTTAQHSPECLLEAAIIQGWSTEDTLAAAKAVFDAMTTPPAAQVQGERDAAIAQFAKTFPMTSESAAGGNQYDIELRRYYMLGWDDRAALSAPPAAGVPEIPAQWSKSLSHCWPQDLDDKDGDWCVGTIDEDGHFYEVLLVEAAQYDAPGESQKIAEAIVALWSFADAPTPPASEQQQAVVMPERDDPEMYAPDSSKYWSAVAWNACMDEWLRLNPNLQPAAPSQGVSDG